MNDYAQIMNNVLPEKVSPAHLADLFGAEVRYERFFQEFLQMTGPLDLDEVQLVSLIQSTFHLTKYCATGGKDYRVAPVLSRVLRDMSLPDDARLMDLPFPEICVELSPEFGKMYDHRAGEQTVRYCFVCLDDRTDVGFTARFALVGGNGISEHSPGRDAKTGDAFFFWKCPVRYDKTLNECMADALEEMRQELTRCGYDADGGLNFKLAETLYRYVINVVLYINSVNADLVWRSVYPDGVEQRLKNLKCPKRRKRLMKINEGKRCKVCLVGSTIKIPRKPSIPTGETRDGRKLDKRSWTPPHWQRYWYKNDDGTKTPRPLYKAGYWRGPELAEKIHTTYVVGES